MHARADLKSVNVPVGFDMYRGFEPQLANQSEVAAVKTYAETRVYPRMSAHQKLVVVPDTFACSNFSFVPLDLASKSVVGKLRDYFEWAKQDERIVVRPPGCGSGRETPFDQARAQAINPWHFNRRHSDNHRECDDQLGAANIPGAVGELAKIGAWVKQQQGG